MNHGFGKASISSSLPEYTNRGAEQIRAAFVPGSFTTIGQISGSTLASGEHVPFRSAGAGVTAFSDFSYMCSPFDLTDEDRSQLRRNHNEKVHKIAGDQPFFAGFSTFKQKQEDQVFEFVHEPYDAKTEMEKQQRYLNESKCLSKPFIPPGKEKALQKPTRVLLGDIMTCLFKALREDWPDAEPTVLSTAEDLIVVYFPMDRAKNVHGVLTYMNNALRRNTVIQEYDLRKVREGWDVVTEDNHLMYTLRPPWVRSRNFLSD